MGKKSDKPKVKRAAPAYMFFVKEERPKVIKSNPNLPFAEVGKELGRRWRALSDGAKKKFQDMAEKDKARAARERAALEKQGKIKKGKK